MFFALKSLGELHALYQFSVRWFMGVFGNVLDTKDLAGDEAKRPDRLIDLMFRETLKSASISVMERHRLSLSLRFVQLRLASLGKPLDPREMVFLFDRSSIVREEADLLSHSFKAALTNRQLSRLSALAALASFSGLGVHLKSNSGEWDDMLSAPLAELSIPSIWGDSLDPQTKAWKGVLLLSALRPDRLAAGLRVLVRSVFGDVTSGLEDISGLVENAPDWLRSIVICSAAGFDAGARVDSLAASRGVQYKAFAMGSAEGVSAADCAVTRAAEQGGWVLLKNVHLASEWLPHLEKRLHRIEPARGFRLFLTVEQEAASALPHSLLLNSQILVVEPAEGLKATLSRSIAAVPAERMSRGPPERARVYILVAWLHGVVSGRLSYTPCGWSKPYEFSETDLSSALDTADELLDKAGEKQTNLEPDTIPWKALRELICTACYGGRIDNEFDFEALTSLLGRLLCRESMDHSHSLTPLVKQGGICLPDSSVAHDLRLWGLTLSAEEVPGWLGMSHDADKLLHSQQALKIVADWFTLQSSQVADASLVAGDSPSIQAPWTSELVKSIDDWLTLLNIDSLAAAVEEQGPEQMAPVARCLGREIRVGIKMLDRVREELRDVKAVIEGKMHRTNAVSLTL